MPPLTRRFIKIAFIYLVIALLMAAAVAARTVWLLPAFIITFRPVYFHLLMVGWVTNLIFGVIYWMFPKQSRDKPHGHEGLWQWTFWLLNIGLVLRAIAEPLHTLNVEGFWGWLLAASALLQWLAAVIFVVNTWPRVKLR